MLGCYIVIYTKALLKYCFYLHFYLDRRNEEDKLREEEVKMCLLFCFLSQNNSSNDNCDIQLQN